MKKIGIATDSHSGILQEDAARLGVYVLPSPFTINGQLYHEGSTLTRSEFFRMQVEGADIHTSQPSPQEVMDLWDRALQEYEQLLYIPISSGLSGGCGMAAALSAEEPYNGRVFVVDNGRVSVPQYVTILDAYELIQKGFPAAQIKALLERYRAEEVIYVAIDDLRYLKKGGRVSSTAALAASILNIKPIVRFDVGTLEVYKKTRGMKHAKQELIGIIRHELETRFRDWYEKGDFYLMTATAVSEEDNAEFVNQVHEAFPGIPVYSGLLALAVCGHIGYGGYGIAVSCKPRIENG